MLPQKRQEIAALQAVVRDDKRQLVKLHHFFSYYSAVESVVRNQKKTNYILHKMSKLRHTAVLLPWKYRVP